MLVSEETKGWWDLSIHPEVVVLGLAILEGGLELGLEKVLAGAVESGGGKRDESQEQRDEFHLERQMR
jgi:hypothetical protein